MRLLFLLLIAPSLFSQSINYGPSIPVTLNGWALGDAMEPFISPDEQYLIWNSDNNGVDTKLYYATRVDDSTWNFVGEIQGANQPNNPQLNAVPDLDSNGVFIWTSARGYPQESNNLWMGDFNAGTVSNIRRVRGDFYKDPLKGWIEMDHGISLDGQILVTNNARFAGSKCNGPCDTEMGLAQKVNDSTFNTLPNSSTIMAAINQSNYVFYAPYISPNLLEIYYTRIPDTVFSPTDMGEIMVATRPNTSAAFGQPQVLWTSNIFFDFDEAPGMTPDLLKMYYHHKVNDTFELRLRYRTSPVGFNSTITQDSKIRIYPNPANDYIRIELNDSQKPSSISILNSNGEVLFRKENPGIKPMVDTSFLAPGNYVIRLISQQTIHHSPFIINP